MTAATEARTGRHGVFDDAWLSAVVCYVIAYNVGTTILGIAEPTRETLAYPAIAIALAVKGASMVKQVPAGIKTNLIAFLMPILVAVAVVALIA